MSTNENLLTVIPGAQYLTYEQMNVIITYQKLWSQLAVWMRNFIYGNLEDSDSLPAVANELFQTLPLNFYYAFRIFYGPEISQVFLNNLTKFLANAWELVNAYKSNDASAIDTSTMQWYQSVDDLASFLASVNIYWSNDQWKNLLYQYIRSVIQEIIAVKGKHYDEEIKIYNNVEDLTDLMGSYMARGIISKNIGASVQGSFLPMRLVSR